jgi:hypothetical protein
MTDDRAKPQYGEYATPEQQAEAMGQVYVPPTPETPAPAPEPNAAPAYPVRQPGYANRFLTVFLLALGALSLFGNIPSYLNLATSLKSVMASADLTPVPVPSSLNAVGIPILIANIVIYGAAVLISILAIRRGRVSFYIPIVGFILFVLVFGVVIAVVAPGYVSQLE